VDPFDCARAVAGGLCLSLTICGQLTLLGRLMNTSSLLSGVVTFEKHTRRIKAATLLGLIFAGSLVSVMFDDDVFDPVESDAHIAPT